MLEIVERDYSIVSCEGVLDDKRWKRLWKGFFDFCVIIVMVNSWGLKWIFGIDFEYVGKEVRVLIE